MNRFDDIKRETEPEEIQLQSATDNEHETIVDVDNHEIKVVKPCSKRGRYKKDAVANATSQKRRVSEVAHIAPETKGFLGKIQATMWLMNGKKQYEDQIIKEALVLFVKHNNLKIN